MANIFISYARPEQPFADKLRTSLIEWKQRPWMDVYDIRSGTRWWDEIDSGLKASDFVLGLLSSAALSSPNVLNEWNWALLARRKLVLMRLDGLQDEALSHRFVGLQWIDYRADESAGFERLRRALERNESPQDAASGVLLLPAPPAMPRVHWLRRWFSPKDRERHNRHNMLQRVHAYWIDGVLRQAVKEANRFNVGYELAPEAVVKHVNYADCEMPAGSDFGKVFSTLGAEVLILGTPGSGKTILLLQLAEQLLDAARSDENKPIPIVLNLASWWRRQEPLADWIANEAGMSYQVPSRTIRRWVDEEAVIPLLDGLDEVLPEHREACVETINHFHRDYRGVSLAVCSRSGDYELLKARLELRAAILLQPLDDRQVDSVVARPELAALRKTLAHEPELSEMTRTPFLLNVMSYAYAGKAEAELRLPRGENDATSRRRHLLDSYVAHRLAETRELRTVPAQRTRTLLAWLAAHMTQRGQTVFHIESLQMDWLAKFGSRCSYCFWSRSLFGLVVVGVMWAVFVGLTTAIIAAFASTEFLTTTDVRVFSVEFGCVMVAWIIYLFHLSGVCAAASEWLRSNSDRPLRRRFQSAFQVIARSVVGALLNVLLWCLIFALFLGLQDGGPDAGKWPKGLRETPIGMGIAVVVLTPLTTTMAIFMARLSARLRITRAVAFQIAFVALYPLIAIPFSSWCIGDPPLAEIVPMCVLFESFQIPAMALIALFGDQIETAERIQWKWNSRASFWTAVMAFALAQPLFLGGIPRPQGATNLFLWFSIVELACLVLFSAPAALFGGILFGFGRAEAIQRRIVPNEGIFRSARTATLLVLGFGASGILLIAIIGLAFAQVWGNYSLDGSCLTAACALALGAFLGSIGAMLGGADVPVKHFVLRALLSTSEKIPWRLRSFLDSCAAQLLLRRVGGGYIFVHRYLLEHFAQIYREQQPKKPPE